MEGSRPSGVFRTTRSSSTTRPCPAITRVFFRDGNSVILEDLRSTNGTFVNGQPITRHVLQHGDEVLVGKHQLMFDQNAAEAQPVAGAPMQGLGDTVYLDTKQHRALRATLSLPALMQPSRFTRERLSRHRQRRAASASCV